MLPSPQILLFNWPAFDLLNDLIQFYYLYYPKILHFAIFPWKVRNRYLLKQYRNVAKCWKLFYSNKKNVYPNAQPSCTQAKNKLRSKCQKKLFLVSNFKYSIMKCFFQNYCNIAILKLRKYRKWKHETTLQTLWSNILILVCLKSERI